MEKQKMLPKRKTISLLIKRGEIMKQIIFCISMTKDLYEKVKEQAKSKEMTVACYIRQAVIEYMERR